MRATKLARVLELADFMTAVGRVPTKLSFLQTALQLSVFLLAVTIVESLTALLRWTSVVLLLRLLLALGIVDTSGKFTVHVCRLHNT
jgi:hypothetical protein